MMPMTKRSSTRILAIVVVGNDVLPDEEAIEGVEGAVEEEEEEEEKEVLPPRVLLQISFPAEQTPLLHVSFTVQGLESLQGESLGRSSM